MENNKKIADEAYNFVAKNKEKDKMSNEEFWMNVVYQAIARTRTDEMQRNQIPCGAERPQRKTLCQMYSGHKGSHSASIFWEDEGSPPLSPPTKKSDEG